MGENINQERFRLQIRLLRWAGISLKEKETLGYTIYSTAILGSILSAAIYASLAVVAHSDRLDTLVENLVFAGALSITFTKIMSVYVVRKKLGKAMLLFDNKLFIPSIARGGKEEEQAIRDCMVYANAQGFLLVLLSTLYSVSPNIQAAKIRINHASNSSYWMLPFGDFTLLNTTYSPVYEAVWTYESIANFVTCIGYSSANVYIAAVMAFISAQCKILQNFIKTSVKRKSPDIEKDGLIQGDEKYLVASEVSWGSLQKVLKEIVEYHMLITDTTNEFESLIYISILLDVLGLSIIICLALFYGTLVPGLSFRFLQMIVLSMGAISLQFMVSYWGDEVTTQYLEIGKACGEVDYVGTDTGFQRGLCIIIQRTQKPVQFTVGKFAPLTLNTFITVMRAAYSYYMLLHNVDI